MRKKVLRNLAIINCFLLMLPDLVLAAENTAESSDVTVLDEVVVTAIPLEKYLVTTSIITDQDIEAKGAQNLSEALEDVPGLHFHRGKKNANTVDIRGSTASYTKIYIDGVLVNPLSKVNGADSVDLDMFPVGNIAKIDVIKGPAPVTYGTDAIGGIILITTKNGKAYQGGQVSLSGGSDDTLNGSVSYGGGDSQFNYYINAGTEHTDGFTNNAFRKSNYFDTKLKWQLQDDASLTFTGGYSSTDKGCLNPIDPVDGHIMSSTKGFWPGLKNWQFRDWEKANLSLDYAQKVDSKWDYDVKIYRFTEKQAMWANGAGYDANSGVTLTNGIKQGSVGSDTGYSTLRWNSSPWKSTLTGVELQSNFKLNALHTLTFGTQYNKTDWKNSASIDPVNDPYNPDRLYWKNYDSKRYGYYIQDNFIPNEKTTVTFGLRRDENEVTNADNASINNSATNPTINVVYQLDRNNTVRASFGKTCSFPLINQLFGTYGNASLKPERAKNYELGLKHQFDRTMSGDIAIFKNDITNMITRPPAIGSRFVNLKYAEIKGLETELNKRFTQRCNGFINYTYLDTATLRDDGVTVSNIKYTPHNNISYGLTYQADKGYKLSLTGHFVSDRETWDDGKNDTRTTVNGEKPVYAAVDSYHVVDLQVKRQINDKQDWYITVNNLFDEQYEDELFYLASGRTVIVGTDLKF